MKKFSLLYTVLLGLFILAGVSMIFFSQKDQGALPEDDVTINKVPGLATTLAINEALKKQLLEEHVTAFEVTQKNKLDTVYLQLEGNQHTSRETYLKDTYNLFVGAASSFTLHKYTIVWTMEKNGEQITVFEVEMSREQIEQLQLASFEDIETFATSFQFSNLIN